MSVTCFLIEHKGKSSLSLRRWARGPVLGSHFHLAFTLIGVGMLKLTPEGYIDSLPAPDPLDPRWPNVCECGYVFQDTDYWKLNQDPIYEDDQGHFWTDRLGDAPPGAMWNESWLARDWATNSDGLYLKVVLPSGEQWAIDGPATNSETGWTRHGIPPLITATPSILSSRYHGYLTNGILTDDLEGRTYE